MKTSYNINNMSNVIFCAFTIFLILVSAMGQVVKGHSDRDPNSITINCNIENPKNIPKIIQELTYNCSVPNLTYSQILTKLEIIDIKTLVLIINPSKNNLTLTPYLFQKLNVTKLVVDYKYENNSKIINFLPMNSEVLYNLKGVVELQIRGVDVFEDNVMRRADIDPPLCDLQTLRVSASRIHRAPFGWLRPCKRLRHLQLSRLGQRDSTKEIRKRILTGAKSLRSLEIHDCFIEDLEEELQDLENLETLDVAHNQIHYALTTVVLPNLMVLDLSHNHIYSSGLLSSGVEKQPRLRSLSLDHNTVLDLCDHLGYRSTDYGPQGAEVKWHDPLFDRNLSLPLLQRFSVRATITRLMCFGDLLMDSLEYMDLSHTGITAVSFADLPVSKARRMEVNVSGCPIEHIFPHGYTFTEEDYGQLTHEELRITGLNVTLLCDCDEYLWVAKAARERKLILDGAVCADGQQLTTVTDRQLSCRKYNCGVCMCRRYWQNSSYPCEECICRRYWKENATDVECGGELHSIPQEPGLRRLYAAGNMVENFTEHDLPDTLIYLDLSKNHIARLSAAASRALFAQPDRRVLMYGNPIVCDCENRPFIQELMDHFDRVLDYPNITCVTDGRLIRLVNPEDLCFGTSRYFMTSVMGAIGTAIGLVALIVGLYYRFGKAVKVYLFSKGLCLFCIREEEIDADRPYDAFVSFSHYDESYVINDLLPGLENEPYFYNLCVHYRDWIAGDIIPLQINQSVAKSKRTIIVLSKHFLESVWGLLEFRTAHLSALKEGRTRLITIIVDDVLENGDLDGEMMSYLRNNTYVKKDDPWFWDKVRFALPHKNIDAEARYNRKETVIEMAVRSKEFKKENDRSDNDVLEELKKQKEPMSSKTQNYVRLENTDSNPNINQLKETNSNDAGISNPGLERDDTVQDSDTESNFLSEETEVSVHNSDTNLNVPVIDRQVSKDSAIEMDK